MQQQRKKERLTDWDRQRSDEPTGRKINGEERKTESVFDPTQMARTIELKKGIVTESDCPIYVYCIVKGLRKENGMKSNLKKREI